MNSFVTADTHYSHKNIAGPLVSDWDRGYRDFDTVEDMNDAIVDSINASVKTDDVLYHLGDWSFGGKDKIEEFYNRLKCQRIVLIFGNHDKNIIKEYQHLFIECHNLLVRRINGKLFTMCHYAMRVWEKSHHGSFHIYGHSHHSLTDLGRSMDVGWCKYRRPLHIDEVISELEKRSVHKVDHHDSNCRE